MENFWQAVQAQCTHIKNHFRRLFPSYRSRLLAQARLEEEKRLAVERARYWENERRKACLAAAEALLQRKQGDLFAGGKGSD